MVLSQKPFSKGKRRNWDPDDETMAMLREIILGEDASEVQGVPMVLPPDDPEENIRRSLSRTIQTLYDIVFSNEWELFITVTFDGSKLDRYDYDEVVERYSKLLDNIKQRKAPALEYVFVPELHKDGAFHFHGLLRNIDGLTLKYSGRKDKKGNKVYNLSDFNLGFNTATYVESTAKVSTYLIKYISKDLIQTLGESRKRYWCTKGLNRVEKNDFMLTDSEQWEMVNILGESKVTVSAKTVNIEKDGYSNRLTYIVYQERSESQEENTRAMWNLLRTVNGVC